MTPADVRVVFMGSPAFAVPSLRALADAGYDIVLAVSQPDRKAGRGGLLREPPVKEAARELGIPTFQPETLKDERALTTLADARAEVAIVAAFGKMLPRSVLGLPTRGTLNVHASLLPRWRGASPINAAILAGDAESGVSIMEIVPKMDAGPVVSRRATPIGERETAGELESRLADLGAGLLVECLPGWLDGSLQAVPQDAAQATYCGLIAKSDGHLDRTMSAVEAERAVRAYNPWPGAFVTYRGERLALWGAHVVPVEGDPRPGALKVIERKPAIAFHGGLLVIDELQRVGARRVAGEAFLNGERGLLEATVGLRD